MVETSTGRTLPVYNAIDSSATATQLTAINASLAQAPGAGQLPQRHLRAVPVRLDRRGGRPRRRVGYALEVQTKPHYSGGFTSGDPSIDTGTQVHELAHQWVGNSATLADVGRHLVQRGLGQLVGAGTGSSSRRRRRPGRDLRRPLRQHAGRGLGGRAGHARRRPGQPVPLLPHLRPRGDDRAGLPRDRRRRDVLRLRPDLLASSPTATSAPRSSSTSAKERSGFTGAKLELLDEYFQQWLYGETKPTILPEDFS